MHEICKDQELSSALQCDLSQKRHLIQKQIQSKFDAKAVTRGPFSMEITIADTIQLDS